MNNIIEINVKDENAVIWKYLDLWKFLFLLTTSTLHFSRVDKFVTEDPSEGLATLQYIEYFFPSLTRDMSKKQKEKFYKDELKRKSDARRFYAVSCWHMNDDENMAMWKLYAKQEYGIAIKTTVQKIIDQINSIKDVKFVIGQVQYRNKIETNSGYIDFYTHHFFIKNPPYEYEREFRVLIDKQPSKPLESKDDSWSSLNQHDTILDSGVQINVNMSQFISEIVLSPFMEDHNVRIIKKISEKYGLRKNIINKSKYDIKSYEKKYRDSIK